MKTAAERYGITEDDWEALINAATEFLASEAGEGSLTSYSELNKTIAEQTGLDPLDFSHPEGRNALAWILGEVVNRTVDDVGAMLSAVVIYIDQNDAGPGFYHLAVDLTEQGRLRGDGLAKDATKEQKTAFWTRQVSAVHSAYKTRRVARRRRR